MSLLDHCCTLAHMPQGSCSKQTIATDSRTLIIPAPAYIGSHTRHTVLAVPVKTANSLYVRPVLKNCS